MTEQDNYLLDDTEEVESIDFMKIAKTIWAGRKTMLFTMSIGAILGLFIAIFTPKEYTVTSVIVPQMGASSSSKLGGLSGLAALAGINMDMTQGSEMSPLIYPKIVSSIPFQLELMNAPLNFQEVDHPVSLFDYYTKYSKANVLGIVKKYTIGLPGVIIGVIKGKPKELALPKKSTGKQLIYLTDDQYAIQKMLDQLVVLEATPKEGFLTLTVVLSDPVAAAQLAQKANEILQRNITSFKIEKAQADLNFIQGRYNVAKAQAEGYQINLAQKTDQFKNLTSSVPQVQTTRIQTRYSVANNVFMELAKQLEMAKIQVKKETPVFTVVQPATIPTEKSGPNKPLILFFWLIIGGIAGISIIMGKPIILGLKQKWNVE